MRWFAFASLFLSAMGNAAIAKRAPSRVQIAGALIEIAAFIAAILTAIAGI